MKYELIIVRYGEIALKGKQTRKRFEDILVSNIKNAFKMENLKSKIVKERGRIYIYTSKINEGLDVLKKIFGITSISPAYKTTSNLNSISELALDISKKSLNEKISFAIKTTRIGNHNYSSQDVSVKVGSDIVKKTNAIVNLTNPDFTLFIEIKENYSYIFTEKISCIGGLPLGTQGEIIALIESISSILAAWYIMKRGCKITFIVTKKTDETLLKDFLKNNYVKSKIISIKKKNLQKENIFSQLDINRYDAIVTNNTIFDDHKTTLNEIKTLKKQSNLPILTPLIALNKQEIKKKCWSIGILK